MKPKPSNFPDSGRPARSVHSPGTPACPRNGVKGVPDHEGRAGRARRAGNVKLQRSVYVLLAGLLAAQSEPTPPADFPTADENLPTEFQCPKCSYRWSGKPS